MADGFDPYLKWLGISPKDQPPHHYRLLGIDLFMDDPDVIEAAADRQMAHIRTYQSGKRAAESHSLLNEISTARVCLLDPEQKAAYDEQLREQLGHEDKKPAPRRRQPPIGTGRAICHPARWAR